VAERIARSLIAVACAVFWAACATDIPDESALRVEMNPFVHADSRDGEAPASVRSQGDSSDSHFCVDAVGNSIGIASDDARIVEFSGLIAEELERLGFEVTGEVPLNETWDRVFSESGEIYDPHDGRIDFVRFEAARRDALAALKSEHGCDFLLVPAIVHVAAGWVNGVVRWDGLDFVFKDGFAPGGSAYGRVGGLSLHVRVYDLEWELVYFGTGGIEPTSNLRGGFFEDEFEEIALDVFLTDDERNQESVGLALHQLVSSAPRRESNRTSEPVKSRRRKGKRVK
jgi:hypothetical protein